MRLIANRFIQTHFGVQNGHDLQRSYKPHFTEYKLLVCKEII